MSGGPALLEVRGLVKNFAVRSGPFGRAKGLIRAVDGVDLDCAAGETLGCVGESGCGKTTLGRAILRLIEPDAGSIRFAGPDGMRDVLRLRGDALRRLRREMQIVFQDPYSSLNPRMRVGDQVAEGMIAHSLRPARERPAAVAALLERVGLDGSAADRYPHAFSGGQRQRIGIARALAVEPRFIVCDEAVSALDVSIQAQIINLLRDLQEEFQLSYLFISHDLSVIRHVSDRVVVMYLGQIVESGPTARLFDRPAHPYTRALLSAIPVAAPGARRARIFLAGEVPSAAHPPAGCRFHTRCPEAKEICGREEPPVLEVEGGGQSRCHFDF